MRCASFFRRSLGRHDRLLSLRGDVFQRAFPKFNEVRHLQLAGKTCTPREFFRSPSRKGD
jgi:hypothetical protein